SCRYRKLMHDKMHTVRGVDPAKVLFLYKLFETKLEYAECRHMKRLFDEYDIVTTSSNHVVISYKLKSNAPPGRNTADSDDDEDEEEMEEEEENGGAKKRKRERRGEEQNENEEEEEAREDEGMGGDAMLLHVSQDSDFTDPDRARRMNLSPVLRSARGTRRDRIDPTSTPHVEKLKRRVAILYDNARYPDEILTDTPTSRGLFVSAVAAASAASAAHPSPPDFTPPPSKRARQQQLQRALAGSSRRRGVVMPSNSPAVKRLKEELRKK
ncbi:hypothetical protein PMAYCL1PPCAC_21825, partial [Pristionchus mayeri]